MSWGRSSTCSIDLEGCASCSRQVCAEFCHGEEYFGLQHGYEVRIRLSCIYIHAVFNSRKWDLFWIFAANKLFFAAVLLQPSTSAHVDQGTTSEI